MPMKQEQKVVLKKMLGPEFSELMVVVVSVSLFSLEGQYLADVAQSLNTKNVGAGELDKEFHQEQP